MLLSCSAPLVPLWLNQKGVTDWFSSWLAHSSLIPWALSSCLQFSCILFLFFNIQLWVFSQFLILPLYTYKGFLHEKYWILWMILSVSIWVKLWVLSRFLLLWYASLYEIYCIYYFKYIKPSLNSWNETNLAIMCDLFKDLLLLYFKNKMLNNDAKSVLQTLEN